MPAKPLDIPPSDCRTGERAMLLNKVDLHARQTIAQAENDRASVLAAAHQAAEATLRDAHGKAIDTIGQNLQRVYMHVGNYNYPDQTTDHWVITDASGALVQTIFHAAGNETAAFGNSGGSITIVGDRVYYVLGITWVNGQRVFGSNKLINTDFDDSDWRDITLFVPDIPERKYETSETGEKVDLTKVYGSMVAGGNIAVDAGRGLAFFVLGAAIIVKTSLSDGSTTRVLELPWSSRMNYSIWRIGVDTERQQIYWSNGQELGVVNYDGSGSAVLSREGTPSSPIDLLAVDSKNGWYYGMQGGEVWRSHRDNLSRTAVLRGHHQFNAVAIDFATQLIYWVDWVDQGYALFRAPLGPGDAPADDAWEHRKMLFAPPTRRILYEMVLLTSTDRASQELASATYQSHHAQIEAPRRIAQAHQDATTRREEAQAKLAQAHTDAEQHIFSTQEQTAERRAQAKLEAQARKDDADRHILRAREDAERKREAARKAAQLQVESAKSDAARATSEKQAELDEARRRLQDS